VLTAAEVRAAARDGRWTGTTRAAAPGHLQCNVVILPERDAADFERWCELNSSVAPILARSAAGDPRLPALGEIDLRHDLPAYRVFADGEPQGEVGDLEAVWTDDLVGFAFGCSFSLEDALRREGVPLDYERRGFGGAIYHTTRETSAVGRYAAPLIVSMRPIPEHAVERVFEVSRRYPQLHGAPVHAGGAAALGIDLDQPLDTIGPVSVAEGERPVFWACGVTTQEVLRRARPVRGFTHVSARMLVCDLTLDDLAAAPA
jgi:uncharacterized protein YcsI (UPF0317 family)